MPSVNTSGLAHALISKRPTFDKEGEICPDSKERLELYKEIAGSITKQVNLTGRVDHDEILTALLDRFTRSNLETGKRFYSFEELSQGTRMYYVRLATDSIDYLNQQNSQGSA